MYRLLRLIIAGYWHDKPKHMHKWETQETLYKAPRHGTNGFSSKTYVLRCSDCGDICKREIF